jgi:hypothetical protein
MKKKHADTCRCCCCVLPPISQSALMGLFEYLGEADRAPCDDTLKATRAYLVGQKLPVKRTIEWLKDNGGFCE